MLLFWLVASQFFHCVCVLLLLLIKLMINNLLPYFLTCTTSPLFIILRESHTKEKMCFLCVVTTLLVNHFTLCLYSSLTFLIPFYLCQPYICIFIPLHDCGFWTVGIQKKKKLCSFYLYTERKKIYICCKFYQSTGYF